MEHKPMREDWLQLLDTMGQGVLFFSANGSILGANAIAEKILSCTSAQIKGRRLSEVFPDIVREDDSPFPEDQQPVFIALTTQCSISNIIMGVRIAPHQKYRWIKSSVQPLFSPDSDHLDQVWMIFSDVTDQVYLRRELIERRKELRAFYSLSEMTKTPNLSLDDFLQQVIEDLPQSWQYPEITCGKINLEGKEYCSSNYKDAPWKLSAAIQMNHVEIGSIEIVYLEERPQEDEGPFLKEERWMLDAIAERLGRVAERRQISEILVEQNEYLKLAQQASHLGEWQQNFLKGIIILDQNACRHFGFDEGVISSKQLLDRIHPDDVQRVLVEAQSTSAHLDLTPVSIEYRVIHPDGSVHWVAANSRVEYAPSGDRYVPVVAFGTSQDITERKQVEEALRKANANYQFIAENVEDVIWVLNLETQKFTFVSPSVQKLRGYTPEEVIQQPLSQVLTPVSLEKVKALLENYLPLFIQGENIPSQTLELEQFCKDGSIVTTEVISSFALDERENIQVIGVSRDVTERKQTQEKLFASEYRNKAIVDAIPDLLFRIQHDGTLIDFKARTEDQLYAPPSLFINKNLAEVVPPEVAEQSMAAIRRAFEQGTLQTFDYCLTLGGQLSTFEGRVVANKEQNEAVVIVRDVTEQRQTEAHLRQSEERYRRLSAELEERVKQRTAEMLDLYDHAPAGYHSLDRTGLIMMINQTELNWLGYAREEVIEKLNVFKILTPESIEIFKRNFPAFIQKGHLHDLELEMVRKDGSTFPIIVNATALYDASGNYLHSRSTIFDNTERKAKEAELRQANTLSNIALELTKAGYWVIPLDGSGEYISSERLIEIYGDEIHPNHHYSLQRDWSKNAHLADPSLADLADQALQDIMNGRGDYLNVEYRYRRPRDGNVVWIHDIGYVVRDTHGNRLSISGVSQDITQQKEMEKEFRIAKEAAENANRAKSMFLANMSHEIRTPMNAILGFTQILLNDASLEEKNRDYLEIIYRSGEHLLNLINEILEMSKIEAGYVTYTPESFNLPILLHDIRSMFYPRVLAKNLTLNLQLAPNLPEYIISDENKLKEILINIVGNAVKFTSQGQITLRCWAEKVPPPADPKRIHLFIDVEDTGVGIAAEELPQLFKSFEQTSSGRQMSGGTGLGLAISQSHARLLGGQITVSSTVGGGSCFHIQITAQEGEKGKGPSDLSRRRVTGLQPGLQVKVLVVDDHEENRLVLQKILEQVGILTQSAQSGSEAVQIASAWQPDLILMDLRMPEMNGFEAAKHIKAIEAGQKIRIVAVTASILEQNKNQVAESGMTGYLRKPFKEYELFSLLENELGPIFLYSDKLAHNEPGNSTDLTNLTPQTLMILPQSLIEAMKIATTNAQIDRLIDLIDDAASYSPPIASKLRELANDFQYETLLKLFEE